MGQTVLVVDDEVEIADLVELYLKNEGFAVRKFYNGHDALECVRTEELDLAILDVMLPDIDGFTLCARIREEHFWPIIMLTAKVEDIDKIMGLTIGADDYITKPFGVMELISRVKALLRRIDRVKKEDLNYGTIRIDVSRHTVQVDGNEVELTYKEYEILKYLMKNRGIVLTRDSLMEKIWGYDFEHGNRTVDVHIQSLRKKLGTAGDAIKTIRNVGYKIGD